MIMLTKPLVLGSGSPRRKEILEKAGFQFSVEVKPTNESFSESMPVGEVASYISAQKVNEFGDEYNDKIVLCSDTVVILNGEIMNKPIDVSEAAMMLKTLSGNQHKVITGVSVKVNGEVNSFSDECFVNFEELSDAEIDYYIKTCKPFDKAGAYGIQDFIGMAKISKLEGSFYTVMGLPVHKVYQALQPYIRWNS
ncbi:Maf family protein [Jiulongibacter sediminis]|uniref:dTTP/UTP pyrophosphatase n=1 Tax=Jiulongibacter sediminis TaxID=1605367 RepID=A0A0P7BRU3_9BACT|nr:Maf family protein [Jiulongibacter sediminis]KPM47094.1 septum formation inhibitor Maf [Jiulongibacter sediminis]TBX22437.1 septum formation inhibitor Maf [Jiulongibacter sediminis]